MNNFKKYAEQEKLDMKAPPDLLKSRIKGAISVFELAGNMVELYIPKVFHVVRDMLGSEHQHEMHKMARKQRFKDIKPPKYPNLPNQ